MIEEYIKNLLDAKYYKELRTPKDVIVSTNYYHADDNTVSVYSNPGSKPDVYDTEYLYPRIQIWIRWSDWNRATARANEIFNLLHKKGEDKHITLYDNSTTDDKGKLIIDYVDEEQMEAKGLENLKAVYEIYFIEAVTEPIRIGVNDKNMMEYSLNFDVTLRKIK